MRVNGAHAKLDQLAALDRLDNYEISATRGFLPDADPVRALPRRFAAWEASARDLPKLLLSGRVRALLEKLPLIDPAPLHSDGEVRRAMMLLSYLGHAFVWGEAESAARIPAAIAMPWCAVAAALERPPVLSYASYALDNWRLIDDGGPVELGNIAILQNFLAGADEDWFIAVHIDIECRAARVLRQVGPALRAVAAKDARALTRSLIEVAHGIAALAATLRRMPEACDPYIYYRRVRPYIFGWKDHPALPDGVAYQGVAAFAGRPQKFRGETGAQSGIVPALDALLGVVHADDPLRAYLMEMRAYMPPGHRAFLTAIEAAPSVRAFVQAEAQGDAALVEAYDSCLAGLETFRSIHLQFAATYIHQQAQHGSANPNAVGTGGTPFMSYLKKHRDETAEHKTAPSS